MIRLGVMARLARVSNLPTVWSNVLAASVLAGGMALPDLALVLIAMSALYTGGMYLNDAFDRKIDARERPERPLPAGEISLTTVWLVGFGLLALGVALLATFGVRSLLGGLALAGAVLLYDAWHKGNALSPLIMGSCRALVYVGTALAAGAALSLPVAAAAAALLLYVAGLTRAAKGGAFQSLATSWPAALLAGPAVLALFQGQVTGLTCFFAGVSVLVIALAIAWLKTGIARDRERAVGFLIAGIAAMDAVVAAAHGRADLALVCLGLFVLTLGLQRIVPGT